MLFANSRRLLPFVLPKRGIKSWPETPVDIEAFMPPEGSRELPIVDAVPTVTIPPDLPAHPKHHKAYYLSRGPEKIHNQLIYKQFGVIALGGGMFEHRHFNIIRLTVNRLIDTQRMFAVWRVDPPWKPMGKKSISKRMGGGKTKIHHYVTPVKAGRIIIEIGGRCEYEEVEYMLNSVCGFLPVDAMPISQAKMNELKEEKLKLDARNMNPFNFEYVIRRNLTNCHSWLSDYDLKWYGKYP